MPEGRWYRCMANCQLPGMRRLRSSITVNSSTITGWPTAMPSMSVYAVITCKDSRWLWDSHTSPWSKTP